MIGRATAARWWVGLGLLLSFSFATRTLELDTDPPTNASKDLSLTTDGSWYVGAALDWASDRPCGIAGAYDPPVFGWPARCVFRVLGPTRWSACFLGVLFSLVAIGFTAGAARNAHGDMAGILAGSFLALSYPYFVHSRAPGIYVPVSALVAVLLYLQTRQVTARPGCARLFGLASWGLVLLGTFGLKAVFLLNGVALARGGGVPAWWRQRSLRRLVLGLGLPVVVAALAVGWQTGWIGARLDKVMYYVSAGDGLGGEVGVAAFAARVLTLESRTGIIALAPFLVVLAVGGAILVRPGRADRVAVWMLALHVALLAILGYSPLRYLLAAFPALAFLAARAVSFLLESRTGSPSTASTTAGWPLRGLRLLLLAYMFLQIELAFTGRAIDRGGADLGVLLIVAFLLGLITALACGACRGAGGWRLRRAMGLVAIVAIVGANTVRGGAALASTERSVVHASREVEAILHPAAHLSGPFAHVLSYESPQRRSFTPVLEFGGGRLERRLREAGFTHLAVDVNPATPDLRRAFAADGATLRLVHEFFIRGQKVHLYRLPWSGEIAPLTDFEQGIRALQASDWPAARQHLERARSRHPRSSAIASALGAVLLESGDPEGARLLLQSALAVNPHEVSAMRSLLEIHLRVGDRGRAGVIAERIRRFDPALQRS